MQVILWSHLTLNRYIIGSIGRARRKWKRCHRWYPVEQSRQNEHMDVIYQETREKYGEDLFKQLAQERRLSSRIFKKEKVPHMLDMSHLQNLKEIKTTYDIYGRLPPNKYEECRKRGRFQRY